jgi:hypothetical protein
MTGTAVKPLPTLLGEGITRIPSLIDLSFSYLSFLEIILINTQTNYLLYVLIFKRIIRGIASVLPEPLTQ